MKYMIVSKYTEDTKHEDKSYLQYIEKHGHHFTNELAQYASNMMQNSNNVDHKWDTQQIQTVIDRLGYIIPSTSTIGDITYTANMCYADFFPSIIDTEDKCIQYAMNVANDIDGYEGIQFCRWLSDVKHKNITITWKNFI